MKQTNGREWLKEQTGDAPTAIGEKAGLPRATFQRRWNANNLTADQLLRIADAYQLDPLTVLRRFGKTSAADPLVPPLETYSIEELYEELGKRIRRLGQRPL